MEDFLSRAGGEKRMAKKTGIFNPCGFIRITQNLLILTEEMSASVFLQDSKVLGALFKNRRPLQQRNPFSWGKFSNMLIRFAR
jgi:hypothetical protein